MPTTQPDTRDLFSEALLHHQAGRLEDADRIYRQILSIEPHHTDSLHALGMIGHRAGQLDAAAALIRQAIRIKDDVPIYYNNLANILKGQGKLNEAAEHYTHALTLKPDYAEAHYNLGCVLHDQGKLKKAIAYYERAIALQPRLTSAYINLGNALKDQGNFDEAIKHYEHVLAIDPDNVGVHYNLGTAYKDQGKFDKAIVHYERMLALKPDHVKTHNNLGVLRRDQGRLDEAIRHFQKATTLKPDHVESHVNEAMTLLLSGDLAAGWQKYEWRWRIEGVKPFETGKPLWDGSDLHGKTILLHGEQGLGDCIQFVRYAPIVKGRGARVLLKCPPALSRLFKSMASVDEILTESGAIRNYDCHAPLMSLPMMLGTTLDTIPNAVPYLFAPPDQISVWAERMQPATGLKVGLVWAGNSRPDHPAAHAVDLRRSMYVAQFAPLADLSGIRFFSLQKGDAARQLQAPLQGLTVIDYMDNVQDFADTAALIANLDLVIGVDTSVVHLAGAMGKPVWILSRFDGCWRWLLDREDSPWYPTLRLFRQPRVGDWKSVIEDVEAALKNVLKQTGQDR
jgi:tetratricopeptide (TPR) repeat protein